MSPESRKWEGRLSGDSPYTFALAYPFSAEDEWHSVHGGGLLVPIQIRVRRSEDNRYVVTGLLIDDHSEVNAAVLRSIKVADIVKHLFAGYAPDSQTVWSVEGDEEFFKVFLPQWQLTRPVENTPPSVDPRIREFAVRYRVAYATEPHRAVAATIATYPKKPGTMKRVVSRSTANRWLEIARSNGLVPQRKDSDD